MENNNEWFPERKGKPFLEKFAMLFTFYLLSKYAFKLFRHIGKQKIQVGWFEFYMASSICGVIAIALNIWNVYSWFDNIIALLGFFIDRAIFKAIFIKD